MVWRIDALEGLVRARAVIADERNWTIGIRMKLRDGGFMAFCALGALDAVGDLENRLAPLLAAQIQDDGWSRFEPYGAEVVVADYNNTHSHAEVLAMFDAAIAAERAKRQAALGKPITSIEVFKRLLDIPVKEVV